MSERTSTIGIDRSEVTRAARDLAYDDYLAALLAPRGCRDELIMVAALMGELARIPLSVSDPALGEIRLQWWRDALAGSARTGHPVADAAIALAPHISAPLIDVISPAIESYAAELYAEPFSSAEAFTAYTSGPVQAAFALRAAILRSGAVAREPIISDAARTLGLVRTCARLPSLLAKGRTPLPVQLLPSETPEGGDEAAIRTAVEGLISEASAAWTVLRPQLRRSGRELRRVVLPAALAGPYLHAIQGIDRDVLRDISEPSPLERAARLWLAARLGRF